MKQAGLPKAYRELRRAHPDFMEAFEAMGQAAREAGPLDSRTAALVKVAYGIAAGLEGATHSQVTRALEAGCTKEEVLQVALLAAPTIGFPTMVRGRGFVLDAMKKNPPVKKRARPTTKKESTKKRAKR